ncbi:hypothetical protein ACTXT7_002538 [Hymenolepis weldensis]
MTKATPPLGIELLTDGIFPQKVVAKVLKPDPHTMNNVRKIIGSTRRVVDKQITAKCFLTNQLDLDLLGFDWLDELKLLKQSIYFLAE